MAATFVVVGYGIIFYIMTDVPVFFQHYYDQRVYMDRNHYQNSSFNLGYITNAYDDRVVIDIVFSEEPELKFQVSEYGDIYGQYSVKSLLCKIIDLPEGKNLDGVVLTQARILFSDSSEMTVDIGKIHLFEHMAEESPIKVVSSLGDSDGTEKTICKILADLTVTAIESPLLEKFKDRVQWKVNGINPNTAVGMALQEGDFFDVTSEISPPKDIISEYTLFDINPKLTFSDDNGVYYSQRLYNINDIYHDYSFMDLFRYIKARKVF